MNDVHESIQGDLAAYALGALEEEAGGRVRVHLRECAACRAAAHEYEAVAGLLPYALAPAEPPSAVRSALLARAAGERARHAPRRSGRWWTRVSVQSLGWAATLAVIAGLAGWNLQLREERDGAAAALDRLLAGDDRQVVRLTGSATAPAAAGQLVLAADGTRAGLMVLSGLPPLPPGRAYQLWFIPPGEPPVSGGVFRVDERGEAVVVVRAPVSPGAVRNIGITEEPAGGVPAPTGPILVTGMF